MSDFEPNDPQYAADFHRQGEVQTAVTAKRSKRWIGRLAGFIFVGMVVGAAIIGLLKFVNDPVSAAISQKTLKASIAPTPIPDGTLNGLYATLKYPGVFNQVSQVKTDTNALEQYNLGSSASYRRTVTIDLRTLPSGNPHDDSTYRLRQIQSDTYTPSSRVINSETVSIMTKNDGSEVAWFWPHQGKLLVVATTTTQPGDHPATFSDVIMSSVRWKQ